MKQILFLLAILIGFQTQAAFVVHAPNTQSSPVESSIAEQQVLTKKVSKKFLKSKQSAREGKSQTVAFILWFVVGFLGIHRFYMGYTGIGIVQLHTFGGFFGIWWLIDGIRLITGDLQPKNGEFTDLLF
jgi:TM2 domain-containing membrane protein YozV